MQESATDRTWNFDLMSCAVDQICLLVGYLDTFTLVKRLNSVGGIDHREGIAEQVFVQIMVFFRKVLQCPLMIVTDFSLNYT